MVKFWTLHHANTKIVMGIGLTKAEAINSAACRVSASNADDPLYPMYIKHVKEHIKSGKYIFNKHSIGLLANV